MTLAIWFWLFYALGLLFGGWNGYSLEPPNRYRWGGSALLFFVLIGLLGYASFGGPVK